MNTYMFAYLIIIRYAFTLWSKFYKSNGIKCNNHVLISNSFNHCNTFQYATSTLSNNRNNLLRRKTSWNEILENSYDLSSFILTKWVEPSSILIRNANFSHIKISKAIICFIDISICWKHSSIILMHLLDRNT